MHMTRLKDVAIRTENIVAYGVSEIPGTLQTPKYFTLTLWVTGVNDPITATYIKEEDRDADLAIVSEQLGITSH